MTDAPQARALLRELAGWWGHYNNDYVAGALRSPAFALSESQTRLGEWREDGRTILISHPHVLRDEWLDVLETLRHEMAHQYVSEILRIKSETPHGPAFRHAAEHLRVSRHARDSCETRGARTGGDAGVIPRRIEKLLSLASSPNEHEAQVAMNKARELLLEHNLEQRDLATGQDYSIAQLGSVKGRHQAWEYELASILSDFFFVRCIWVPSYDAHSGERGSRVEVYGRPENVALADYVHAYLSRVVEQLWQAYKVERNVDSNRDRRTYYLGLLTGFHTKLQEQDRARAEQKALVWKGDPKLDSFYRHRNPRVRTVGGSGPAFNEAYHHGRSDGRSISIQKPVKGSSENRGRRLGAG